jgi:hypothetical protein
MNDDDGLLTADEKRALSRDNCGITLLLNYYWKKI